MEFDTIGLVRYWVSVWRLLAVNQVCSGSWHADWRQRGCCGRCHSNGARHLHLRSSPVVALGGAQTATSSASQRIGFWRRRGCPPSGSLRYSNKVWCFQISATQMLPGADWAAAWLLGICYVGRLVRRPGGPPRQNFEIGQMTYTISRENVERERRKGSEGQSHKEEEREGGSWTAEGRGPGALS